MTNFAYNQGIPNPPNQPSQDVPLMKINTNSISGIIAVDHIGFEANNGGTHLQTQFVDFSAGGIPAGTPASVAFPAAGSASSTVAEYYFKNSLATLLISGVKAFGSLTFQTLSTGPAVALQFSNGYNIVLSGSTQQQTGAGINVFTINLSPGCVVGTNAVVFIYAGTQFTLSYATYVVNANQLVITYNSIPSPANPGIINFAILQA